MTGGKSVIGLRDKAVRADLVEMSHYTRSESEERAGLPMPVMAIDLKDSVPIIFAQWERN